MSTLPLGARAERLTTEDHDRGSSRVGDHGPMAWSIGRGSKGVESSRVERGWTRLGPPRRRCRLVRWVFLSPLLRVPSCEMGALHRPISPLCASEVSGHKNPLQAVRDAHACADRRRGPTSTRAEAERRPFSPRRKSGGGQNGRLWVRFAGPLLVPAREGKAHRGQSSDTNVIGVGLVRWTGPARARGENF